MMGLLLGFAEEREEIRLVTLEGSRANPSIVPDSYQDYDISYFVTDRTALLASDDWLERFGERVILQKPEDMELFPPELGSGFSYLMLLADGNKIDLTLYPVDDLDQYFADSDGLVEVLMDKDGKCKREVEATDESYWIKKPTARSFDDCCNEFWFVSTYVVKGLARGELLYAIDHLSEIARPNLLRMMSWRIGAERGYTFSVGKNYKFIDRYLPAADWELLLSTYVQGGSEEMRRALQTCYALFRKYSRETAEMLGYAYPNYDEQVTRYTEAHLT